MKKSPLLLLSLILFLGSGCAITQVARKSAKQNLLQKSSLKNSNVGIAIYDPQKDKYIYTHQANNTFIPASNTKLFTLFTGLTLLQDSTTGIQYQTVNDTMYIRGTGDPSFLHPDFSKQPVFKFLEKTKIPLVMTNPVDENPIFGPSWNPLYYNASWQPERSAFPIYGNVVRFSLKNKNIQVIPPFFSKKDRLIPDKSLRVNTFSVRREIDKNVFHYHIYKNSKRTIAVPFMTHNGKTAAQLLADTLHKDIFFEPHQSKRLSSDKWESVHNILIDSLFKMMMHRSDNFFAEQVLQMSSMKLFDTINTTRIIHYIKQNNLKDLPDKPVWVDGSGLSRQNHISPKDFIFVLKNLYENYSKERINNILPTGGEGTLTSLYHKMKGAIFAKTGTLGGSVIALSGYLTTKKGRLLYFSVLVNEATLAPSQTRKKIEQFLYEIWDKK